MNSDFRPRRIREPKQDKRLNSYRNNGSYVTPRTWPCLRPMQGECQLTLISQPLFRTVLRLDGKSNVALLVLGGIQDTSS